MITHAATLRGLDRANFRLASAKRRTGVSMGGDPGNGRAVPSAWSKQSARIETQSQSGRRALHPKGWSARTHSPR